MYLCIALSQRTLARLIRFRLVDAFRPLTTPFPYRRGRYWVDGLTVRGVELSHGLTGASVPLRRVDGEQVIGILGRSFAQSAAVVELRLTAHLAEVDEVRRAALDGPTTADYDVPNGALRVLVTADVTNGGEPFLRFAVDGAALAHHGVPAPIADLIETAATGTAPFPVNAALAELVPGAERAVNAATAVDANRNLIVRCGFGDDSSPESAQLAEWNAFATSPPAARLGAHDWCLDVDGNMVAAASATTMDSEFVNRPPLQFRAGRIAWGFHNGTPPAITIEKPGWVSRACSGFDLDFTAHVGATLAPLSDGDGVSVVTGINVEKSDYDTLRCIVATALNPFSLVITMIDQGAGRYSIWAMLSAMFLPVNGLVALAGAFAVGIGVDKTVVRSKLDQAMAKQPEVTKVGEGRYEMRMQIDLSNDVTGDWMRLRDITGESGRLLFRGSVDVPDTVLPRLVGQNSSGFTEWGLVDRCNTSRGHETRAGVQLRLRGGYGGLSPSARPTIPLHFATRPDGGQLFFEIVDDTTGIYREGGGTQYRVVGVTGIPGEVESVLRSSTLRLQRYAAFAERPYPLRLRFYTNAGVREYVFRAPQVFVDKDETLAEKAERINHCMLLTHDLVTQKYLQLRWLIDPPPDARFGQHWQATITGLSEGQTLTVWDQHRGAVLARERVNAAGAVEMSIVVPPERFAPTLLVGLDDPPFLDAGGIEQLRAQSGGRGAAASAAPSIVTQQTPLHRLDSVGLGAPAEQVVVRVLGLAPVIEAQTAHGGRIMHQLPETVAAAVDVARGLSTYRPPSPPSLAQHVSASASSGAARAAEREILRLGGRAALPPPVGPVVASPQPAGLASDAPSSPEQSSTGHSRTGPLRTPDDAQSPGAGPEFEVGEVDDLVVCVEDGGRRVSVYRRGLAALATGMEWQD